MNYYIIYDYLNKNVEFNSMSGENKHQLASLFCTIYNLYHVDSYIVSEFDIKSMYGPMVDPDLVISAVDSLYREMEII